MTEVATLTMQQLIAAVVVINMTLLLIKVWLDFQRNRIVTRIERWIVWEKLTPNERDQWTRLNKG